MNEETNVLRIGKSVKYYIESARQSIIDKDLDTAKLLLKEALVIDTSSPEIKNLLGVIEEKCNHKQLAQKYYRAALSLAATFAPADNNLNRTAMFNPISTRIYLG